MKLSKFTLASFFTLMQLIVAFGFQPSKVIQPSITELKNDPLKYEDMIVRVIGWLGVGGGPDAWSIENDEGNIRIISADRIKSDLFVQKDSLYEKFWRTRPGYDIHNPCKTAVEVEVEGVVKKNKEVLYLDGIVRIIDIPIIIEGEVWRPDDAIFGVLVITRVIRIEEKYRTPPVGICAPEEPENVVPPTIPDWIKPERKELNFFEGIRDTKAE